MPSFLRGCAVAAAFTLAALAFSSGAVSAQGIPPGAAPPPPPPMTDHAMPGMMQHHAELMTGMPDPKPSPVDATLAGQDAYGAVQEIVRILEADPKTDWSKVNIDALRQHLIDMNSVTLAANVKNEPIDGGMRFDVTGEGPVRDSIRRMTTAHAATMNGVDGWKFEAAEIEGGAALTVHAPAKDVDKLRGLGFLGVLTLGMHHQVHHLMIARGENPHG
jgi:hypothetical protein